MRDESIKDEANRIEKSINVSSKGIKISNDEDGYCMFFNLSICRLNLSDILVTLNKTFGLIYKCNFNFIYNNISDRFDILFYETEDFIKFCRAIWLFD